MTTAFQSNAFQSNAFQINGENQGDRSGWWRLQLIKAVQDQNKQRESLKALVKKKEDASLPVVKKKKKIKKEAVKVYVRREIVEDYHPVTPIPHIDESEIIAKQQFVKIIKDNESIIARITAIPKSPDVEGSLEDLTEIQQYLEEQAAITYEYNNAALLALGVL